MSQATDSAGIPFAGREFSPVPFAGDTGEADPVLLDFLEAYHRLARDPGAHSDALGDAWARLIEALGTSRLLIPLVAHAGEMGLTPEGSTVEKTQELSVIHVEGPDGRPVAPVFSSVSKMAAWNPQARPIPVEASRAALAAADDHLRLIVLDPGSEHTVVLRAGALRALASKSRYIPPWCDEAVAKEIARGLEHAYSDVLSEIERDAVGHRLATGDRHHNLSGAEVQVELVLPQGLGRDQLEALLSKATAAWSASAVLAERVDGLAVKVVAA